MNKPKLIDPFDNIEALKKFAPEIDWEKKKRDLIKYWDGLLKRKPNYPFS